jgi:hypothetical protein
MIKKREINVFGLYLDSGLNSNFFLQGQLKAWRKRQWECSRDKWENGEWRWLFTSYNRVEKRTWNKLKGNAKRERNDVENDALCIQQLRISLIETLVPTWVRESAVLIKWILFSLCTAFLHVRCDGLKKLNNLKEFETKGHNLII